MPNHNLPPSAISRPSANFPPNQAGSPLHLTATKTPAAGGHPQRILMPPLQSHTPTLRPHGSHSLEALGCHVPSDGGLIMRCTALARRPSAPVTHGLSFAPRPHRRPIAVLSFSRRLTHLSLPTLPCILSLSFPPSQSLGSISGPGPSFHDRRAECSHICL